MKSGIVCVTVTLILSAIAIVLLEFGTQQLNLNPSIIINPMEDTRNTDSDSEVIHQFYFFNVLKDGRVNVFSPPMEFLPPSDDPTTGVKIKDVQISPNVSARVFLPPSASTSKLPVMLYVHGGGFCMQSAFNAEYTGFVADLAAQAKIIAVSVEYGLFPARPIPACYEDSWEAFRWIASHAAGSGPEPWLNEHGDLERVFMAGDSAGANICHTLAARVGLTGSSNSIEGMIMVHPYFGEDDKMWMYMCPTNEGPRDRRMKASEEDLKRLGSRRVLVLVAENDPLRSAGLGYVEELKKSGFKGRVELVENKGREHCFHLSNHLDVEALSNMARIISFIQQQPLI